MVQILLSATTIKQIAYNIGQEISNNLVDDATRLVQGTLLKDTLTQDFYDDLYQKWTGNTMTAAYTYLKENYLDYILAYGVWQHLIITLSYQLNPAGLRLKTSDHSQMAEASDMTFMRKYIQDFIDARRKEMDRYIYEHQTDYPLYYSDKWGDTPVRKNFGIGRVDGNPEEPCAYWKTIN